MTIATILRRGTVLFVLIALVIFFSLNSDRFLQERNLVNIAVQNAHIIIVTVGMTLVMLSGGIDLSIGSVAALTGAVAAGLIVQNSVPVPLAMLLGLALGFAIGLINGWMVVYGKLPPFVATLAMLGMARGLTLVYTNGRPIANIGDEFTFWGRGTIGPIPTPIVVWVVVVIVAILLMTRTRFGLHIYAIGGNEETARLAGVPVNRVKMLTFGISGFLAALGGLLLTARVFSAQPQAAVGLELDAITAAVLGGVSLFGGVGNIPGAIIGALLVGVLGNGMNLLRVASYPQQVIQGVVLVLAVTIDMYTKRLERGAPKT
ncbi:MAG: ABC transporter permease [Chloroflexi bacterium]|nr:ABC transporter permease [Chloroflexota bacterium]